MSGVRAHAEQIIPIQWEAFVTNLPPEVREQRHIMTALKSAYYAGAYAYRAGMVAILGGASAAVDGLNAGLDKFAATTDLQAKQGRTDA